MSRLVSPISRKNRENDKISQIRNRTFKDKIHSQLELLKSFLENLIEISKLKYLMNSQKIC